MAYRDLPRRLNDAELVADQDPLLPIYNRRAFVRELARVKASVERYQTEASLVYIDLNQFKSVNDSLGHEAGDYVLSQVALRLKARPCRPACPPVLCPSAPGKIRNRP